MLVVVVVFTIVVIIITTNTIATNTVDINPNACDAFVCQAWQQQPPPFLQQQRPLRRLPTAPVEVAQAVQQKVVGMCHMSQHSQGDTQDIQHLMTAALLQVSSALTVNELWAEGAHHQAERRGFFCFCTTMDP